MPYKNKEDKNRNERARYYKNKDVALTRGKKRKEHLKEWYNSLKSIPCADCGIQYPPYVMDWDHRPGTIKIKQVSYILYNGGKKKTLEEIAKCDLVCSNCHRERTYGKRDHLT